MRIVLWDIDGTLLNTGGAGIRALSQAVGASEGATKALERMRLAGMTDRAIARILCAAHTHHENPNQDLVDVQKAVTDKEISDVLGRYVEQLGETINTTDGFTLMPGVEEVLDELAPIVVHALGTGNVEEGARIKLERGGIWRRFSFGGYGDDAETRADMLRAARRKADAYLKRTSTPDEFVVVGDTPLDIIAAHEVGFACVAIATGGYSVKELAEHGADAVFENLLAENARSAIVTVSRG